MSTNTTTIRASLYTVVEALTTKGKILGRKTFHKAAQSVNAELRPASDVDREVTITDLRRETINSFGNVSAYECTCTFDLVVGHLKTGDLDEASARRDRDVHRIAAALEKPANYPSDVWLIRFESSAIEELDDRWYSTLTFSIQAALETD